MHRRRHRSRTGHPDARPPEGIRGSLGATVAAIRDAKLFRTRYGARFVACADEVPQLAPIAIDEAVREGDLIAGALRVIHLPGKSAGEIGLYFDPGHHAVSREMGGTLLLGDAIIGNPPGALSLIPKPKLDDPAKLKRSLPKLLD